MRFEVTKNESSQRPSKDASDALEQALPDQLRMLAEQLSDDALHLASLYPASAPKSWEAAAIVMEKSAAEQPPTELSTQHRAEQAARNMASKLKWGVAAASLLLACSVAWKIRPVSESATPIAVPLPSHWDNSAAATHLNPPSRPLVTFHPVNNQPDSAQRDLQEAATRMNVSTVPTGLFMNLSSPEQEALLDVMEDEELTQASVSL